MFKKIKGTFQSAQQDFVESLKALTSLENQPRHEQLRNVRSQDINLDVGADLLHSYQQAWESIQADTKESARRSEELSLILLPLFKSWDWHAEMMDTLSQEVKNIPKILSTLKETQDLLGELRKDFAVVEKSMDLLENLCEELDQKKKMNVELQKLAQYKTKKLLEAEKVKVELAQNHAKKMAVLESAKLHKLQERAEAFTSAFQEDLEYYRTHGHTDRIPTEFPKVTSLSEIEIDEDPSALNSFLGPDTEGALGQDDLNAEETYIEDDYITGFAIKQDSEYDEDIDQVINEIKLTMDEEDAAGSVTGGDEVQGVNVDIKEDDRGKKEVVVSESSQSVGTVSKDSGIDETEGNATQQS